MATFQLKGIPEKRDIVNCARERVKCKGVDRE